MGGDELIKNYCLLLFCLLYFATSGYCSDEQYHIKAFVTSVIDGDTLAVRLYNGRTLKARLYGIDAPEKKQPLGLESYQHLQQLCEKKHVTIDLMAADRYGRIVVQIKCNSINANISQLSKGLAWVYHSYIDDQQILNLYSKAQEKAKELNTGLWQGKEPIPPWEFRRGKR